MKRIITTTICIIAIFLPTSSAFAKRIGFGIKGGLNIADLYGDDINGWDSKMAFCAGGFVTFSVHNIVVIQPELLYTMKGAKAKVEFNGTLEGWINLNYLEIPVLFKLTMPSPGMVKPNLFVGPYFAYNLSATAKEEANGESVEEDVDEYIRDIDFGLAFGLGVDFNLGKGKIVFDARYSLGLTSIDDPETGDPADIKNKVISFMLGYSF